MNRRGFLAGIIAAPAVIRVAPLMRIVAIEPRIISIEEYIAASPETHAAWRLMRNIVMEPFPKGGLFKYTPGTINIEIGQL